MSEKKQQPKIQNPERKRGQRKLLRFSAWMFIIIIALISVINIIKPKRSFSEKENRMLAGHPQISANSIASGRFMKQYETYKSDQFIARDLLVSARATLGMLTGERELHGVFNGSDNYLLEDIVSSDSDSTKANIKAIKKFQGDYPDIPMNMMLVPNAANILNDKLPLFAEVKDQNAMFREVKKELGKKIGWIDVSKTMKKHADDDIYYRTDHHWTTQGAYYAFGDAAEKLGITSDRLVDMKAYPVTDAFNGTLSSESGYETTYREPIYIYLPEEDTAKVVVNYVEEQKKTVSMYDSSKLKEKDKYAVFFGGNTGLMDIKTTSNSTERLLMFKDSYANCFIPFLTSYFREIVVVDPRYYYGKLGDLMDTYAITQVLFLYNGNTFFKDNNLSGVLTSGK